MATQDETKQHPRYEYKMVLVSRSTMGGAIADDAAEGWRFVHQISGCDKGFPGDCNAHAWFLMEREKWN